MHELRDPSPRDCPRTPRAPPPLGTKPCALDERLEAVARDVAVVHEQVLRTFIRTDEAVTLAVVEPLDGSVCHEKTPPSRRYERVRKASETQTELALICGQRSTRGHG